MKFLLKPTFHFTFGLAISLSICWGQDNSNKSVYSLLWKIESESSKKPSYLFGTMHVDDAKVFNFSDAVMPAIEQSDFFALEIDPEAMMALYSTKDYDQEAHEFYQELLDEEDYKRLKDRFREINGYDLETSEIRDPEAIITLITPEPEKDNDKSTFVDMYLYGIAETLQRTTVGLEAPESQVFHFENMPREDKVAYVMSFLEYDTTELNSQREEMADIYSTGDLSKIEAYIQSNNFAYTDMESRNQVMLNSILNYMQKGSIFAAVGAAHLPGEEGLIKLLRNKGLKVSIAEATFTGVANTYKIDDSKKRWYTFTDDTLNFKVQIPKAPNVSDNFEEFTIYGYSDLTNKSNYMFMGINTGFQFQKEQQHFMINKMISNIMTSRNATIQKKDSLQESDRLIYIVESKLDERQKMKTKVIYKNGCVYYFSAEGETLENPSMNRFFNSIDVEGIKPIDIPQTRWRVLTHEEGKFKISIPSDPKNLSRETPNPLSPDTEPYKLNLYLATDIENENNYLYRYNDLPIGYYALGIEEMSNEMEQSLEGNAEILSEPKPIELQGVMGYEYELLLQDRFHCIARFYLRGNRTYLIMKQKLNTIDKVSTDDTFFNDFSFLPLDKIKKETYRQLKNEAFEVDLFEQVKKEIDTEDYSDTYVDASIDFYSKNPHSGGVYHISYSDIKKYFKAKDYKTLYESYKDVLTTWNDTIVDEYYKVKNTDSTFVFKIKDKSELKSERLKIYSVQLKESRMFLTEFVTTEEEIQLGTIDHIFNSLVIYPNKKKIDIFNSKADLILSDLKSKDSLVYTQALGSFDYYEYTEDEVPQLHEALFEYYPMDSAQQVQQKIIDEFSYVSASGTAKILQNYYLETDNSETKALILGTLSDLTSEDRLDVYKTLISKDPPMNATEYAYGILRPFRDSIAFSIDNSELLYSLLSKKELRADIVNLTRGFIVEDSLTLDRFKKGYDELFRFVDFDYNKYAASPEDTGYYSDNIYAYLSFLKEVYFANPAIDKLTQNLLNNDDASNWMQLNALLARLHCGYSLSKKIFKKYIDDYYTRFEFMEVLKERNELDKVPENYFEPVEFGKLSLYNYVVDDSVLPKQIKHLGTIEDKDALYAVYAIEYENYDQLGVVDISIQPLGQESFEQYKAYSEFTEVEDDWKAQAKDYIKYLQENPY